MYESSQVPSSVLLTMILADVGAAPVARRPAVQMPDEYLPPNKILFLQNLPESVTKDQLDALFSQYPNLHEVRLVPSKKDIAFVEYLEEGSATVAKDALHNYKLDGENKIKVRQAAQRFLSLISSLFPRSPSPGNKVTRRLPRHRLGIPILGILVTVNLSRVLSVDMNPLSRVFAAQTLIFYS